MGSSNLKHIYLVRHGQSHENLIGVREAGVSPLTEKGKEQAVKVGKRLEEIGMDVILASHYVRARETGEIISGETGVPLEIIDDAQERKLPESMIGKHRDDPEVRIAVAKFEYAWKKGVTLDDGESFDEILERTKRLTKILESREETSIALATHELFTKFFVAYHLLGDYLTPDLFINKFMYSLHGSNTGITYFVINDEKKWTLLSWSDYAHLGKIKYERH